MILLLDGNCGLLSCAFSHKMFSISSSETTHSNTSSQKLIKELSTSTRMVALSLLHCRHLYLPMVFPMFYKSTSHSCLVLFLSHVSVSDLLWSIIWQILYHPDESNDI